MSEQGKAAGAEVRRDASKGNRSQVPHTLSHAVPAPFLSAGTSLPPTPHPCPLCLFSDGCFQSQVVYFPHKTRRSRADHRRDWRFGFPCAPRCSPASWSGSERLGFPGDLSPAQVGRTGETCYGGSLMSAPVAYQDMRRPKNSLGAHDLPSPHHTIEIIRRAR